MQLRNTFTVPVPVEEAWPVLLDLARVAPCMPGAEVISIEGADLRGRVKVKLGPIRVGYEGTITIVERDESLHRAVLHAAARENRGSGTARATIAAEMTSGEAGSTEVAVTTDLDITGRPAQFGRGVMADVSDHILRQFAENLSAQLAAGVGNAVDTAAPDVVAPTSVTRKADPLTVPTRVPLPAPVSNDIDALALIAVPIRRHGPAVLVGAVLGGALGWILGRQARRSAPKRRSGARFRG